MELGIRLSAVANLILPTETFADVGCDHGYLSVYLIEKKICHKVIAMDVRKGPLERAKQTIEKYGCGAFVEPRLSDGIKKLALREADGFVCAGMGGRLVLQILYQDKEKVAQMNQVILQPQSELWLVRRMLAQWNMDIEEECMVFEDGKYYPMMRIRPNIGFASAKPVLDEKFLTGYQKNGWKHHAEELYGKKMLETKDGVLKEFLEKEKERLTLIRNNLLQGEQCSQKAERLEALQQELCITENAISYFYK